MKFFWGKVLFALCLTSLGVLNANAQRGKGWYVQLGGGIDVVTNGDSETMGAVLVYLKLSHLLVLVMVGLSIHHIVILQ
jgi:hypothetical protein